ncbi:hypothetical protein F5Y16DRAFT_191750 [Xylariaceae sp. FL0255]|nr:hypothetical protein F5Y16DRAFT_191750 [Xylariaceae sp. FL0255]
MTVPTKVIDARSSMLGSPSKPQELSQSHTDNTMHSLRPSGASTSRNRMRLGPKQLTVSMLVAAHTAMAQQCISLAGSSTCPAFQDASISTASNVTAIYPFLSLVTDVDSFDSQLSQYITGTWRTQRYESDGQFGCGAVNTSNSDLYARFTTSVFCNGIVQNSLPLCSESTNASRPLCIDSCSGYAESEAYIIADPSLCPSPGSNADAQLRADFQDCALPASSLNPSTCINAIDNEPNNCGYGESTLGLCSYCGSGGTNSTDTCCYNSDVQNRCAGVVLPSITPSDNFTSALSTSTATPTSTPGASGAGSGEKSGLSSGAIAGIVIGSILGALLLAVILFFCLKRGMFRRRRQSTDNIFNQPSPTRKGPQTSQVAGATAPHGYEVLPGGRIARMSALEGHSGDSPSRPSGSRRGGSAGAATAAGAVGAAAGYATGRRKMDNQSSTDSFKESPRSETRAGVLRPPPTNIRRNGSLSSNSVLAGEDAQSPTSAGGMSSPPGMNSQQSEQLPFFKDYYSQDDIHPGGRVAVLWAYQPRATDEFALERGDMLKVVGIWDDGWATGIMMDERADEWEARRQAQRDSGVSNTSGRGRDISPPVSGEIKAFPLVCVCLPEHWRKTIEGDGSTETGSSAAQQLTQQP